MSAQAALAALELAAGLSQGNSLDDAQRTVLRGFTGWGALAPAFASEPKGQWAAAADRLEEILGVGEFLSASEQLDTSFFTPAPVIEAAYTLLRATGFTGGKVLEPGCGIGSFMSEAPVEWDIDWTGVEADPTSARIAALLHPEATILQGKLETTPLHDEHFDAVIGNVPFSGVRVYDSDGYGGALHNYFIQRSLAAVRPGGYVIMVTSRHSMDSLNGLRHDLDTHKFDAALIGAVRLPSGAFAESGTDAVTDIIVLRRNDVTTTLPAWPSAPDTETVRDTYAYGYSRTEDRRLQVTTPDKPETSPLPERVSRYWAENPQHVAGEMRLTTYERSPLVVRSAAPDHDIAAAVHDLAGRLPLIAARDEAASLEDVVLADAEGRKEGSLHLVDDALYVVKRGALEPIRANKELTALVALRDLAVQLLEAESDITAPDASMSSLRAETRAAYLAYVERFGALNRGTLVEGKTDEESGLPALSWRRPAMGGFRRDPDSALVMALEEFDQETGEATPAPILLHRVNRAPACVSRVETPAEALSVSLGESGRVDLARIAKLLELASEAETLVALGDLVFHDGQRWVSASEFLSGNVRTKLRDAEARGDDRGAEALRAVLPADLGPEDIRARLGSPFVRASDVEAFMSEVFGCTWATVKHTPATGTWEASGSRASAEAGLEYGTPDAEPVWLVDRALNSRMPEVTNRHWDSDKSRWVEVKDIAKSAAANEKLQVIHDRFALWVWEDGERAERICAEYNERMNSHVTRVYSGAGLTFPGLSADVTPYPHQRAAVERIVSTPRAMLAHPVGAGKTLEFLLGARTLRQFGLASKPLIIVPNHLLEQVSREARQAFPTGKFLIATKEDLARDSRRVFAARCATGDWDAVIMTHSSFTAIPVRPENERAWLGEQKVRLRWAMSRETGDRKAAGPKAISRAMRALDARMSKLRSGMGDPDTIWFEQLGVDYIFVDESHLFRRLDLGSSSRDNGMGSGSSKRATDLLVKIETLAERKGHGAPVCAFFTGTPWSNTLAETWVWQRFMQPEVLEDLDVYAFDAWASAFVKYETNIEVAPDASGFRMQRRPVGLVNFPELKTHLAQFADIVDPDSLGLGRPEHSVETVVVPASPGQRDFMRELAERADAIHRKQGDKRIGRTGEMVDDSMLLVCNDGRKVALDPHLVGLDEASSKIAEAGARIAKVYRENAERIIAGRPGVFQLAFLDLGTPKPGESSTYGRLRREVVRHGVPANQVRFIHEATTDKARAALFAQCREGDVALLIASTSKAGIGTNVQTRLSHIWHIDVPWLPAEVIQRDGRGVRPHNLTGHVTSTRMVTEGSFDAYGWQAVERKSRSFDALYASGSSEREIEDISAATMSYGEVKALASGNPLLLEQAQAQAEVSRLQLMRSVHLQAVHKAEKAAKTHAGRASELERAAERATEARSVATETTDLAVLVSTVESWKKQAAQARSYSYGLSGRVRWRGLMMEASDDRKRLSEVTLKHDYFTLLTIPIPPALARRTPENIARHIAVEANRYVDTLELHITRLREQAGDARRLSAEAKKAADSSVFSDEAKLRAAIERLARIETSIAAEAEDVALAA